MSEEIESVEYVDAFCGATLDPSRDRVLRVSVSPMNGAEVQQDFFVHRDCFVRVLQEQIPLGQVFDEKYSVGSPTLCVDDPLPEMPN